MTQRIFKNTLYRYKLTSIYRNKRQFVSRFVIFFSSFVKSRRDSNYQLPLIIVIHHHRYSFPRDFISSNRSSWHLYTEKQWSTSFVTWSLNHPSVILRFLAPAPVPLCLSLSICLSFSSSSPGACASRFRTGLPWSTRASTPPSPPYPNYCLYDIESRIKLAINATARPKPQTGYIELNISCVQIVI